MANKTINQLTDASVPILTSDKMIVSRDGTTLTKSNIGDLPLKTINSQSVLGTGDIAISGNTNLGNNLTSSTVELTSSTGTGTTISAATTSAAGVMSAEDKIALNNKYDLEFPAIIGPATVRGIANRSGWPNQFTAGQLISGTVAKNISKTVDRVKLLFVGASQYVENLLTSPATFQGKINYPIGSDNWHTVTFDGGSINGVIPSSGEFRIYESDWVDFTWHEGAELMLYLSSIGGNMPTMGASQGTAEWAINGRVYREFQLQLNATSASAGQLEFLSNNQLKLLSSPLPNTRIVTNVTYNGTQSVLRVWNHNITSLSTSKLLLEGFTSSGASLNGLFSASLSGSHDLLITMSDPGTVSELGVFRIVAVPSAVAYNSGSITITRVSHGLLPGDVVCLRGFSVTTGNLNFDVVITSTTTDTFTFAWATNPGTITFTNAYYYSKYPNGVSYHMRPVAFLGESDVECTALVSDSTSSTVDFINDPNTLVQGVAERCVGEAIPFINISATNDGLYNWFVSNPTKHAQRQEVIKRYAQTITFGFQKNDENNYNLGNYAGWLGIYENFWDVADFATHKATGKNKLILTVTRNTPSRDAWSTKDGMIQTLNESTQALAIFQKRALEDMGIIYNMVFDLNIPYCEPGLIGIYKTSKRARNITVTTTSGSSIVNVSASTPISIEDDGEVVALVGAESSGNTRQFGTIKYISPTSFYFMGVGSSRFKARNTGTNALTDGIAIIGAHYSVQQSNGTTDVVHESTTILQNISNTIALKRVG